MTGARREAMISKSNWIQIGSQQMGFYRQGRTKGSPIKELGEIPNPVFNPVFNRYIRGDYYEEDDKNGWDLWESVS